MTDILEEWHPIMVATRIKRAMGDRKQQDVAAILGITPQYLCDILHTRRNLSPEVAAKLFRVSAELDGRHLYTMQEKRRVEIAWRYEVGELKAPWLDAPHVKQKGKTKRAKSLSKKAYSGITKKAWRVRKRQARARAAAAENVGVKAA